MEGKSRMKNLVLAAAAITLLALAGCKATAPAHAGSVPAPTTQAAPSPATVSAPQPEQLATVWIQGDSISLGYWEDVQQQLQGRAVVTHNPDVDPPYWHIGNARDSGTSRDAEAGWMDGQHFDVCHFNNGEWDIAHRIPTPHNRWHLDINGPITTSKAQYADNLQAEIDVMRPHCSVLIFATTTPVEAGAKGRVPSDVDAYNAVAIQVMEKNGVMVDDLNAYIKPVFSSFTPHSLGVHYPPEGYQYLAYQVTDSIERALLLLQLERLKSKWHNAGTGG